MEKMTKNPNEFKNKQVRTKMYLALKKEKSKNKKKQKLENKDKPKQAPKTIENCRIKDETFMNNIQNDQEILFDLNTDEISCHMKRQFNSHNEKCMNEDEFEKTIQEEKEELDDDEKEEESDTNDPKVLITTNDIKIGYRTYKFCRELSRILPNAHYFYKKKVRLSKIIPAATKRNYSAIIVVNENRKQPGILK